jgi:hypothetical protein
MAGDVTRALVGARIGFLCPTGVFPGRSRSFPVICPCVSDLRNRPVFAARVRATGRNYLRHAV